MVDHPGVKTVNDNIWVVHSCDVKEPVVRRTE